MDEVKRSPSKNHAGIYYIACTLYGHLYDSESFQQEEVLTELHTYISQNPPPVDAPHAKCTLQYLTACSQLFEYGLLSHKKVSMTDKAVLESINTGYRFFVNWHQSLIEEGT